MVEQSSYLPSSQLVLSSYTCPIKHSAQLHPAANAIIDNYKRFTYAELDQKVDLLATYFFKNGLTNASKIVFLQENSIEFIIAYFAAQRLGATVVALNLKLAESDWHKQINIANANFAFVDDKYLNVLPDQLYVFTKQAIQTKLTANPSEPINYPQQNIITELPAVIVFTSGSTGHVKGVVLSNSNFLSSASASNNITGLTQGDCWAVSTPLYHVSGLGIIYRCFLAGAACYIPDNFSADHLIESLATGSYNFISLVPTVLADLINNTSFQDINCHKKLKAIVLAGAPSGKKLIEQIQQLSLPVMSAWGMTETAAHCTCTRLKDPLVKVTTVGLPFDNTKIKIVDSNGNSAATGEILVKGPTVCLGYIGTDNNNNNLKLTNGWLHTGDLGELDQDGYLKIIGRTDSMIISGGENIHISEIEELAASFPNVKTAAVVAIDHERWGQRPILFIEQQPNKTVDSAILNEFLAQTLAKIKRPDQIIILDQLPYTAIGKVNYAALKQRLEK